MLGYQRLSVFSAVFGTIKISLTRVKHISKACQLLSIKAGTDVALIASNLHLSFSFFGFFNRSQSLTLYH